MTIVVALATALPAADRSAPPTHPDSHHVLNGCYISATAYLARFRAEFPTERATTLAINPRGYAGKHTIAVVTWEGRWWGRDEYFGVFQLECSTATCPDPSALATRATKIFHSHTVAEVRAGRAEAAPAFSGDLPAAERARLILLAARLLPCPSEVFWVSDHAEEAPFLFFRPTNGQVAVYDPASGTCRAATECENPARLVRQTATQLGYAVSEVRGSAVRATSHHLAAVR